MPAPKAAAVPQTESSTFLSVSAIDSADDRREIVLDVPEWNGRVKLQGLSYDAISIARTQSWDARKKETNEDLLNAWCLTLGLVEPKINVETAKQWIMHRAFGPVNTILTEILSASGLGKRAADAAKSPPAS